jgi:beta-mannosidase
MREGDDWFITLATDRLAQSVHIDVEGYRAEEDWFHLAPGPAKRVKLIAAAGTDGDALPAGEIRSVGAARRFAL